MVIIPARTPLPGHHNTARTTQYQYFVHQYYVLLCMMIVERDRKPDYRSPHLSAHETQHSKKYCIGQSAVQNIVQKTAQNAVKYALRNAVTKTLQNLVRHCTHCYLWDIVVLCHNAHSILCASLCTNKETCNLHGVQN